MSTRHFLKVFFLLWGLPFICVPMIIVGASEDKGGMLAFAIPFGLIGLAGIAISATLIVQDIQLKTRGQRVNGLIVSIGDNGSYMVNNSKPISMNIGYTDEYGNPRYMHVDTDETDRTKFHVGDYVTVLSYKNRQVIENHVMTMSHNTEFERKMIEEYAYTSGNIYTVECKSCGADVRIVNGVGVCQYCGEVVRA